MGEETKIAWTDSTFNPWVGCTKVSPGCANCYAAAQDHRWGHDRWGKGKPRTRTTPANWRKPLAWNEAARLAGTRPKVFCSSLADVFDAEVEVSWLGDLARLITQTPNLDWLLLTKRPENYWRWKAAVGSNASDPVSWPANVWLGVTCENQEQAERRIPLLLAQDAVVRFLSCEPLLGPVRLDGFLRGLDWCIVGGESGAKARPFDLGWARSLVAQCRNAGVAPFVKQLGLRPVGLWHPRDAAPDYDGDAWTLRDRAGADPAEWPEDLRVREFPEARR